jgi:hypothetical protein
MSLPWYSDAEIDEMCHPLTQPAAQVKYLRAQGLHVTVRPNGRARVMRAHAEAVLSGATALTEAATPTPAHRQPNRSALVLAYGRRAA